MRASSVWVVLSLSIGSACNGEVVSLGQQRCVGTSCSGVASPDQGYSQTSTGIEQAPEAAASVVWQAAPRECPDGDCDIVWAPASSTHWGRWGVHTDGSVSVADAYLEAGSKPLGTGGVFVTHFAPDGTVLWRKDVLRNARAGLVSTTGSTALAVAPDGAIVVAVGGFGSEDRLSVHRLSHDDGLSVQDAELFSHAGGTRPAAMAWTGDDLLIAGYSPGGEYESPRHPEVSRYRQDGTLVWRQTALQTIWNYETRQTPAPTPASGIGIASDTMGRSLVLVPFPDVYGFAQLDEDGTLAWSREFFENISSPEHPKGQVRLDRDGRFVVGQDAYDGYTLLRCDNPPVCDSTTHLGRSRRSYYQPTLDGLALDTASRIHVMTQDGDVDHRRVILDRYPANLLRRETFVVGAPYELLKQVSDISIGPDGDVYYFGDSGLGRIHLEEIEQAGAD